MLAYSDAGRGQAVVLLHGFPLSKATWGAQVNHLAAQYRVIAPDLPGLGESPLLSGGTPSIARMAREVLALLDALGVQRAAVAGHSMGGYVALALQKEAPERVAGLGLICTQAGADTPEGREARFATARKVRQEGPPTLAEGMGPKLFAPGTATGSEVYEQVVRLIRRSTVNGIQRALYAMADREDHRARLSEIQVPTLVLTAAQDQLIPPERSALMAAAIPGATLITLPDAGHMPMLEAPDAVSSALAAWLTRVYG